MVKDQASLESLLPALDSPPAYDSVQAESSVSAPRQPPKDTLHLFAPPPNAEPLFGHRATPDTVLASIGATRNGSHLSSSDSRLQDPDVLYDWIRYQAVNHPRATLRCFGYHFETPERDEWVNDRDGSRQRHKGRTEQITDFDFTIDLTPAIVHPENHANVHLATVSPEEPAYRGKNMKTYAASHLQIEGAGGYESLLTGSVDSGHSVSMADQELYDGWRQWKADRGLPIWMEMKDTPEFFDSRGKGKATAEQPTEAPPGAKFETNLKSWCEKFTADPGYLKVMRVPVRFWGWNFEALRTAVRGAITSTGYQSNGLSVELNFDTLDISARPSNWLSNAVNNRFVYALLWLTMLYPIIWIWQHLHRLGGGIYEVAHLTYGFKFYPSLPATFPTETLEAASDRIGGMYKMHSELPKPAQLTYGPQGVHYLLGRKEGEWFREWEERIRMGVRMRYKGQLEGGGEEEAGTGLDGY